MIVEFLKFASDDIIDLLAEMLTDIVTNACGTPSYWKQAWIKVLHKKGDKSLAENYRPICIIPILYKVYSRILLSRIEHTLELAQCCDQAGFRKSFSTEDHLVSISLLAEGCMEMSRPLWVAALDFRKAFDTINHSDVWTTLRQQNVQECYVTALQRVYEQQQGCIDCGTASRPFKIERGTKQGPMTSFANTNVRGSKSFAGGRRMTFHKEGYEGSWSVVPTEDL